MRARPWLSLLLILGLGPAGGCTLIKPVVGAFTAPILVLGHSDGHFCGCDCGDGRAVVAVFAVIAAVGACGGLVTGIVSDINVLCGRAPDPCANFWDPFATNTGRSSF